MATTVKLKNLQRRMRVFNLEHPSVRVDGKPGALTILAMDTVEVHPDVLKCVEVAACLQPEKGQPTLRVVQ